ncbi:unnamed protein product [Adineta steineri]|uniref:Protein kinase domain-containing protein n=1 Tax=Adineta steineri TaxID=433720 RepID=A0A818L2E1_9BILA|nr:unnamed protein product [Adineta steineri]
MLAFFGKGTGVYFEFVCRLQQGAKIFASTVVQVKANGNQCRRLSQRIDYVIEDILKKSDVLHQYPETIKTLERLESIIQQCQDLIKEFTNDLTWYKKIFYHQNYKDQFASLNQQIEQCTKDLHLSISLQVLFDRKEDENDQQKDMNEIQTKLDEIVQLMARQQESIENLLNKQYASFRHHLDQNLRKTTDVRVAQAIEQQVQHFLPIPFYDLRVEKCIGQGGFADVYRGVWLSQQHEVAIKIIRVTHLTDRVTQEFMREIHIMHKIRCDHVLNVFGACMEPQVYALVIEYMELGSLFDVLQKKKIQFTWPDRWSIALQMVKGINYLHHLQPPVVHRDIKSLNFLLKEGARQQFVIKVGDFGLADIRKETIRQTNCNNITPPSTIGTVQWLAPELFTFGRPTLASDVFALAVVFWELATGLIPYEHSNESVIRLAVCHGDRLVIPTEIPDQFRDIITRAWAQDPNTRSTCPMIIDAITLSILNINEHQMDSSALVDHHEEQIQREKSKFQQLGITVAGGNDDGPEFDQLSYPQGIFIDNDKSLYIADSENHRIVKWKLNSNTGEIIIGENGKGNQNNQLNEPRDIIYDKENNSFIISDAENKRVIRYIIQNQQTRLPSIIRYFIQNQTNEQIIISNIKCWGLTIDKNGFIYVSDCENHEVRRWKQGDEKGELVAGGNGHGKQLNQLNKPTFIFINEDYSLYISDTDNHRVMKWKKDAKEGIIVAGGNDKGNSFKQLSYPRGVIVDHLGQIYVADCGNHRIVRWCEGDREGKIVVGGNDKGNQSNQLHYPKGLSFDNEGNLYVVDEENHRIQKYEKLIK